MTYIMPIKSEFRYPTERYLNVIKRGYKDCKLDKSFWFSSHLAVAILSASAFILS